MWPSFLSPQQQKFALERKKYCKKSNNVRFTSPSPCLFEQSRQYTNKLAPARNNIRHVYNSYNITRFMSLAVSNYRGAADKFKLTLILSQTRHGVAEEFVIKQYSEPGINWVVLSGELILFLSLLLFTSFPSTVTHRHFWTQDKTLKIFIYFFENQ